MTRIAISSSTGAPSLALAEDLDSGPRREELVSGLQAVAEAGPDLEVLQATADELLADADLAWRSFACSLLVEELASEPQLTSF